MLDQIKIASPCSADWDQMEGTDRVRFCAECKKNVYNISALTRRDAEALLKQTNGNLCTRLYRRADGKVLTADCPIGFRVKIARVQRRIGWAIAGTLGFSTAWAQSNANLSGSIRNPDGSMAAKTSIFIKGDHIIMETITDDHGVFGTIVLVPGKYWIQTVQSPVQSLELKAGDAIELVFQRVLTPEFVVVGETQTRKSWWRRLFS